MRKLLFVFMLLTLSSTIFAQKVKVKKDVILVDDKPYGYIKSQGDDYVVQSLDNENRIHFKLIIIAQGLVYYEANFLGSGKKAQYEHSFRFATNLAKELVQLNVLNEKGVNPEGERQFLAAHIENIEEKLKKLNGLMSQDKEAVTNKESSSEKRDDSQNIVQRNTESEINVYGTTVKQDFKEIANIKKESSAITGEKVEFYFPNGVLCAKIIFPELMGEECTITTTSDHKQYKLKVKYDDYEKMAKFLVDRLYL